MIHSLHQTPVFLLQPPSVRPSGPPTRVSGVGNGSSADIRRGLTPSLSISGHRSSFRTFPLLHSDDRPPDDRDPCPVGPARMVRPTRGLQTAPRHKPRLVVELPGHDGSDLQKALHEHDLRSPRDPCPTPVPTGRGCLRTGWG